jgi:hypothetical protein
MLKWTTVLAALLLVAAIPAAWADWDPDQAAKWVQFPDLSFYGIDVNASPDDVGGNYILADDFLCTEEGPITDIHLWGSWLGDYLPIGDPNAVMFVLSIHEDIPDTSSPTGYSMPGDVLWYRYFYPGEFTARVWEYGIREGWLNPPEQYFFPADTVCWQYNFFIDEADAFYQTGTPDRPVVYWLDVQAIPEDMQARWGWKTSVDHWNDNAVWGQGTEPYYGPWYELKYPPGHELYGQPIDLAFVITSHQQDELDWGDAPDFPGALGYPTLAIHNGANHAIVAGGPWLGDNTDLPDPEGDGQPDPNALGDDNDGNDDEDGVAIPVLTQGQTATISFQVSGGPAYVFGWIDYNGDQVWQHPAEQVYYGSVASGMHAFNFTVPTTAVVGQTFARFRISTMDSLLPVGPAPDGEVEDYEVFIEEDPQTHKWMQPPDLRTTGIDINDTHFILTNNFLYTKHN